MPLLAFDSAAVPVVPVVWVGGAPFALDAAAGALVRLEPVPRVVAVTACGGVIVAAPAPAAPCCL